MGWEERDYTWYPGRGRWLDWRPWLPSRAAAGLIALHVAGCLALLVLASNYDPAIAQRLALRGACENLEAIVLHPYANPGILNLIFLVLVIASFGRRISNGVGPGRMLAQYFGGNLLAGVAFAVVGRLSPPFAAGPLDVPLGGLAAWTVAAWRLVPFESVNIFGRTFPLARVALVLGGVWALAQLLNFGPGAVAWLLAAVAGGASMLLIEMLRFDPRRRVARARRSPARTVQPSRPKPGASPAPAEFDVDDILAKISREGVQALTPQERQRLEAAREARLRSSPPSESSRR